MGHGPVDVAKIKVTTQMYRELAHMLIRLSDSRGWSNDSVSDGGL